MSLSSDQHIQAELERLDLLLQREILRLRTAYHLSLDEFRGLYVSDQQVDYLIDEAGSNGSEPTVHELTMRAEALARETADLSAGDVPMTRLTTRFGLSRFERDVVLLGLAPEVNLKYETLYAYLNNNASRPAPTVDLALRLFCTHPSERMSLRRYLLPNANLLRSGLLQFITTAEHPSWLATSISLAPGLAHYLMGFPFWADGLSPLVENVTPMARWDELPLSPDLAQSLHRIPELVSPSPAGAPLLVFEGRHGAGRSRAAEAVCRDLGIRLLRLDLEAAQAAGQPLGSIIRALALQQRIQPSGVYLCGIQAWIDREGKPTSAVFETMHAFKELAGPVFVAGEQGTPWRLALQGQRIVVFPFCDPPYRDRLQLWQRFTAPYGAIPPEDVAELADRFILTSGQIEHAVSAALDTHAISPQETSPGFFAAARDQSDQRVGSLAGRMKLIHSWDDLVLPDLTLQQVRAVAAAIRYRHIVYSTWGFDQRFASNSGVKVLFAGASGTGKTMTAGVIARDLGLDLYKINLSEIVSKYIGETEKNLENVFRAAEWSNAILFFDEADALFGKRAEVKDAHDRYANIEVAYLLQRMEEHQGPVILASNLSKNIDDAFARRLQYVIEFPLPGPAQRESLWRAMFPPQAPLHQDVDFSFMATQFPIAGGDIKNVALEAAFLAAQNGRVISMRHIIQAMAHQAMKQGKVPAATDFKQYYAFIGAKA